MRHDGCRAKSSVPVYPSEGTRMQLDEVRAAMEDPVAQRLLESPTPARLAYVALDGTPGVGRVGSHGDGRARSTGPVPGTPKVAARGGTGGAALTSDTTPPIWPPGISRS